VIERCKLPSSVKRTIIGFMGCYAAINALKLARHIIRSEAAARVVIVNLELCTLHLKETANLEEVLSFLLFGDGCAASLISAEPIGTMLDSFHAVLVPDTRDLITWSIRDSGFDMECPAEFQLRSTMLCKVALPKFSAALRSTPSIFGLCTPVAVRCSTPWSVPLRLPRLRFRLRATYCAAMEICLLRPSCL
jgi:hypothetical protein